MGTTSRTLRYRMGVCTDLRSARRAAPQCFGFTLLPTRSRATLGSISGSNSGTGLIPGSEPRFHDRGDAAAQDRRLIELAATSTLRNRHATGHRLLDPVSAEQTSSSRHALEEERHGGGRGEDHDGSILLAPVWGIGRTQGVDSFNGTRPATLRRWPESRNGAT